MQVTDVRIRKIEAESKMKAIVSITLDDEFVIHDIKIIEGTNGKFVAMLSRKLGPGDFRDIAHPILSEARDKLHDAIMEKFDQMEIEEAANKEEQLETEEFSVETIV